MAEIPVEYYNQKNSEKQPIKAKWWAEDEKSIHMHVFGVVKGIKQQQNYRHLNNLRYARLYSNMDVASLTGGLFARTPDANSLLTNRVSYNVIRACCDTATAKIGKSRPRPLFLTEDGKWNLQQKAKLLTQFIAGQFDTMGNGQGADRSFYGIGRNAFQDATIFGTGAVKLYIDHNEKKAKAEKVFIDELIIDEAEGRYRAPRQIHHCKLVHREIAYDLWPRHAKQIAACPSGLNAEQQISNAADMIEVLESWHLPSSKDAGDGKHVISIENATLFCEEYKHDYFPFLFLRWAVNPLGFFGRGIGEELLGIQLEINKLLRTIQVSQHLMAVPQVWLNIESKVVTKHLNNKIGGIKYYSGQPPTFFTPQAMSSEIYQYLENLYQKAYELTGISQLSAGSKKPSGLDAAVALREYQDIESERFSIVSQSYQEFFIDATYMLLDLNREMVKLGYNPKVQVSDTSYMRDISFKEVDIPNDTTVIRAYPTNILPQTPAGKLQQVQEMVQAGFYTQEEALDLLDFPDIEKANKTKLAPKNSVIKVIEYNLENAGKDYLSPEPYMNLNYAKTMAQSYYLMGRADGMPEDRLDVMRRFMEDIEALLNPELPDPNAMMAPQPGMDPMANQMAALPPEAGAVDMMGLAQQGAPAPAPVSPLIPNV